MKNIHGKFTKRIAIAGLSTVIAMLISSAALHIGAGICFDIFTANSISADLIEAVRPFSVICAAGCLSIEYTHRKCT